ncbi:MAG: hypothetical protein KAH30_02545 [Caldisericia bacterium]|nr:hypothetical protein [Caldisericia bacterium]
MYQTIKSANIEMMIIGLEDLGLTEEQAIEEYEIIENAGSLESYLRISRVGMASIGGRKGRKKAFDLYELWIGEVA